MTGAGAELDGATAVVTGGGKGIGAAIARRLAAAGAHVTVAGRDEAALAAVAAQIHGDGGRAAHAVADVTDADAVERLMATAAGTSDRLDVLVNNAGIAGPVKPLADLSLAEWDETLAVNLTGVFLCCRAAIPYLRRAPRAAIVNLGSVIGKRPAAERTPYASTKLGVVGLTRSLARELGPDGITVNTISPFLVDNPRTRRVVAETADRAGRDPAALREAMLAETALGRMVDEADVAALALFLCSEGARSMTGQDMNVSAGAVTY